MNRLKPQVGDVDQHEIRANHQLVALEDQSMNANFDQKPVGNPGEMLSSFHLLTSSHMLMCYFEDLDAHVQEIIIDLFASIIENKQQIMLIAETAYCL